MFTCLCKPNNLKMDLLLLCYLFIIAGILLMYMLKNKLIYVSPVSFVKLGNGEMLKRLPGPPCLPLVGHIQLLFQKDPPKYLAHLARTYGDAFQFKLGYRTVIVLNSLDVIKSALQEWEFAGRPDFISFDTINMVSGHPRITFSNYSTQMKFHRKSAIKALGTFANSKNSRLQKLVDEASISFTNDVRQNLDRPFNPKASIGECVAAIIGAINFGGQFDRKNRIILELVKFTNFTARFLQIGTILDYFPFGRWIMRSRLKEFIQLSSPMFAFSEKHIRMHKYSDDVTDVADALYVKSKELTQEELDRADTTSDNIQMLAQDLFIAGFATILETLNWCMALMGKYANIQERLATEIQKAIDANCGEQLTLSDIKKTPYVEAFLLEVFRFTSLKPLNSAHYTISATTLQGYYIPKGAVVIANLYSVHYDSKVFNKPDEFDPTRFLNSDGSVDVDMGQKIVPFSVGKRRCFGEKLARQELYLLLTAIIHKFTVSPVPGQEIEVHKTDNGFTRRVFQQNLIFGLRK